MKDNEIISPEIPKIVVDSGESVVLLDQKDIFRIYSEGRQLYVCCADASFTSKLPLQEYEKILIRDYFVRISRFEIVNLMKVSSFELSAAGTIRISFDNGSSSWVARRYVDDIQKTLGNLRGGKQHE